MSGISQFVSSLESERLLSVYVSFLFSFFFKKIYKCLNVSSKQIVSRQK